MPSQHDSVPRKPVIDLENFWHVCRMPDLGELKGPEPAKQHVVDHSFIKADNGKWQLWACIRGTRVGRLLYRWEGDSLDEGPWEDKGIAARAEERYGEGVKEEDGQRVEHIGAPFFLKEGDRYCCLYHSSGGIRLMDSEDGISYRRTLDESGSNVLYPDGGRDIMVLKLGDVFHGYSTVTTRNDAGELYSYVLLKTSRDLRKWGDATVVCEGGVASEGPVAFESPFVVALDGYFYLFRSSSWDFKTYVYRSPDPSYFARNDDANLIAVYDLKAPEIVQYQGNWYISDLGDFQGIRMRRFEWVEDGRGR